MALGHKQVALSTSAAKILDGSTKKCCVKVKNNDASIVVYVGDTGVTTSTGYKLVGGAEVTIEYPGASDDLYAVAASGTPSVSVMRVN